MYDILPMLGDCPSKSEMKAIRLFYRIVDPHCYAHKDSIYGENDIVSLLNDPSVSIDKWPTVPPRKSSIVMFDQTVDNDAKYHVDFYKKESKNMLKAYTDHLLKRGHMLSYDDVVLKCNVVDISAFIKDMRKTQPDSDGYRPGLDETLITALRPHKWYAFVPCFNELTIRFDRKRFMHIKVTDIIEQKKSISIKITHYIGDKYDWISCDTISYDMRFADNNSMTFTYHDCISYEEMLIKYVNNLGWNKKQINFWYDLFGLNDIKNAALISIEDDVIDKKFETIVFNLPEFNKVKKIFDFITFHTKAMGENVIPEIQSVVSTERLEMYMKFIACINSELYANAGSIKTDQVDKNGRLTRCYDHGVTIYSKTDPIIPERDFVPKPVNEGNDE